MELSQPRLSPFGFTVDRKIIDVIDSGRFTLSAEIIPPRNGAEQAQLMTQIRLLIDSGAEFLSVTRGAGGSLRAGSLPIAQAIKENHKIPAIAHFTCRDLTPAEVENQLVDHHYFGVRNILALRGDPPTDQPDWRPRPGSYSYAYELIDQIARMNRGEFLSRENDRAFHASQGPKAHTEFCIGAAVYPEHHDTGERIEFFRKKVQAGAEYGITQMLFDVDIYARFLDELARGGVAVPIVPGVRILRSKKQALTMAKRFGVRVPQAWINALPDEASPESLAQCVDVFLKYVEGLKMAGAPGLHVFVLSDMLSATEVLRALRK